MTQGAAMAQRVVTPCTNSVLRMLGMPASRLQQWVFV